MNDQVAAFETTVAAKPPEAYYDTGRKEYMMQDKHGSWFGRTGTQFKRVLRGHGISEQRDKETGISPQDAAILHLEQDRNVVWSGPIAGYKTGFYEMGGKRVLVTTSPRIIDPSEGDWGMLRTVIENVLGDRNGEQIPYFLCWLKIGYEALRAEKRQPGQAVVFCGPHGCGKSLLQHVITSVLGGRSAKPYQAMSNGTAFNSDWFEAEHLMVEDEQPSTDIRARRAFGDQIKNITVADVQRNHGKHRDPLHLQPFWRLSISLNDEPENVMVLPPIDDSLEDKLMIFKAVKKEMPMSTATAAARSAFWTRLESELPAMLDHLVKVEIPMEMRCERFGVKHYHHPEIRQILNDLAPETRLLALMDALFFTDRNEGGFEHKALEFYEDTAESIERRLTGQWTGFEHEARRLFSWNNACGTYLGRLAKSQPDRVKQVRKADTRLWRILPPKVAADPAGAATPATAGAAAPVSPAADPAGAAAPAAGAASVLSPVA